LRQVFKMSEAPSPPMTPYSPPYTLYSIRVYVHCTVYSKLIHTGRGGGEEGES
jgi:hypothetical protein